MTAAWNMPEKIVVPARSTYWLSRGITHADGTEEGSTLVGEFSSLKCATRHAEKQERRKLRWYRRGTGGASSLEIIQDRAPFLRIVYEVTAPHEQTKKGD